MIPQTEDEYREWLASRKHDWNMCILGVVFFGLCLVLVICCSTGVLARSHRGGKRKGRGFGDVEEVWDGTPYYRTNELVIA